MKKILVTILSGSIFYSANAQQLVRASHVYLVSTTRTPDTLNIVSKGGITYTGGSNFIQNGKLTLYSNPVGGNADWIDSTVGVLTAGSTGLVNFKGDVALQT